MAENSRSSCCPRDSFAPLYLAFDSILTMNAFEPVFWLACACIAVRSPTADRRNSGCYSDVISGIGLENKHTMAVFGFGVVVGFLLSRELRPFRSDGSGSVD